MSAERQALIDRWRRVRSDIEQIFIDAAYWNRIHLDSEPIDPDPDGQLSRIADALDKALAKEGANDSAATATVQAIVTEGEQR